MKSLRMLAWCVVIGVIAAVIGAAIGAVVVVASQDRIGHAVQIHLTLTVDEARELLSAAGTGTPIPARTAKHVASATVKALSGRKGER